MFGETLCPLQVRAKENCDAVRLGNMDKSTIAQHVHQQEEPHKIDWKTMSVIDTAQAWQKRNLREALKIHKRQQKIEHRHWIRTPHMHNIDGTLFCNMQHQEQPSSLPVGQIHFSFLSLPHLGF